MKKILRTKMAFGRHVIKIRIIALERQNRAQSKAHGLKNARKICLKMDILASWGLNFEIRVINSPRMDILGLFGLNFFYSRNINLSREISKLLILPASELNDNNFFEIFLPISVKKLYTVRYRRKILMFDISLFFQVMFKEK